MGVVRCLGLGGHRPAPSPPSPNSIPLRATRTYTHKKQASSLTLPDVGNRGPQGRHSGGHRQRQARKPQRPQHGPAPLDAASSCCFRSPHDGDTTGLDTCCCCCWGWGRGLEESLGHGQEGSQRQHSQRRRRRWPHHFLVGPVAWRWYGFVIEKGLALLARSASLARRSARLADDY